MTQTISTAPPTQFTGYQKFVLAILAFLQFTIILDFMIMSPLGAILMPALNITPSQFGVVVSAYAFSAGIAGFAAAGFADRFDRKKLLMFFYCGFILGTFLCGIAPNFYFLLFARIVTGLFGGVIGAIVMAITTDLFPFSMRGRVMGVLQTAFAGSQILGLPIGLYLSAHWGWHAPFMMIVGMAAIVGVIIIVNLKPIDGHLKLQSDRNPFHHLRDTIATPRYLLAFAATGFLSIGGYMLMPFSSAFAVNNLGISMKELPMIYLVTGFGAIITGPLVGKLSDKFGKYRVFLFGAAMTIVMAVIYTRLGVTPLPMVILVNVLLFVGIFSRMIPAQAMMSAVPAADSRGAFMAINSSLQQIAGGVGSVVAGMIVSQPAAGGAILHFDLLGDILVCTVLLTAVMMYFIHRMVATPAAVPA
ncbi:MFS transporter [Undibacterium sp. CY18W]|uniref:MFS transporter n=1 Tax=Undibacterium hunanense TaxID=2762292 RepID=A0ABR6ZKK2_9BURK|nr:MFS transporter [Undibacterium hunanense]MBC3916420.1 MFS transporter [Undibacterium hunanense]